MLKKILFPIDNSESSKRVLPFVIDLATKFNSEVILLHTYLVPDEIISILGDTDPDLHKVEEKIKDGCKNLMNKYKKRLTEKGIKVITEIIRGDAEYDIVKIAKVQNCDLIMIASRGHNSVMSFLLGSVSNYVLHHSHCPVMLIH